MYLLLSYLWLTYCVIKCYVGLSKTKGHKQDLICVRACMIQMFQMAYKPDLICVEDLCHDVETWHIHRMSNPNGCQRKLQAWAI